MVKIFMNSELCAEGEPISKMDNFQIISYDVESRET